MKKNVLPPETIRYIAALEKQVATQKDLIEAQKDLIDAMQRQKEELDAILSVTIPNCLLALRVFWRVVDFKTFL